MLDEGQRNGRRFRDHGMWKCDSRPGQSWLRSARPVSHWIFRIFGVLT